MSRGPPAEVSDLPSYRVMRGPPPAPGATMRSAVPSRLTSAEASRNPPRKVGYGSPKKSGISFWSVPPAQTCTRGPPPASGPIITSALPSPFRSPVARTTPPVKLSNGVTSKINWCVAPSQMRTRAWMPPPEPTMMSGTPSPLTSARATRAPPVYVGPKGVIEKSSEPADGLKAAECRLALVRRGDWVEELIVDRVVLPVDRLHAPLAAVERGHANLPGVFVRERHRQVLRRFVRKDDIRLPRSAEEQLRSEAGEVRAVRGGIVVRRGHHVAVRPGSVGVERVVHQLRGLRRPRVVPIDVVAGDGDLAVGRVNGDRRPESGVRRAVLRGVNRRRLPRAAAIGREVQLAVYGRERAGDVKLRRVRHVGVVVGVDRHRDEARGPVAAGEPDIDARVGGVGDLGE